MPPSTKKKKKINSNQQWNKAVHIFTQFQPYFKNKVQGFNYLK